MIKNSDKHRTKEPVISDPTHPVTHHIGGEAVTQKRTEHSEASKVNAGYVNLDDYERNQLTAEGGSNNRESWVAKAEKADKNHDKGVQGY